MNPLQLLLCLYSKEQQILTIENVDSFKSRIKYLLRLTGLYVITYGDNNKTKELALVM